MKKLNLACGNKVLSDYMNVDKYIEDSGNTLKQNLLNFPWIKISNNIYDEILIFHFLEHIPTNKFFNFMNEVFRVIKNGGVLRIIVPYPSIDCLCRPFHVNVISHKTFSVWDKNKNISSLEKEKENNNIIMELVDRKIKRKFRIWKLIDYHFRKYLHIEFGRKNELHLTYKIIIK